MMPLALEMLVQNLLFVAEDVKTEPTLLGEPIVSDHARGRERLLGPRPGRRPGSAGAAAGWPRKVTRS